MFVATAASGTVGGGGGSGAGGGGGSGAGGGGGGCARFRCAFFEFLLLVVGFAAMFMPLD